MKKSVTLPLVALLAIGLVYYVGIPAVYGCDGDAVVNVSLVHDKPEVEPIELDIPCEYIYRHPAHPTMFPTHDGDYDFITISFFKDTLEPTMPWHDAQDTGYSQTWRDDEIRVKLSRSGYRDEEFEASFPESKSIHTKNRTLLSENDKFSSDYEVWALKPAEFPKGTYTLYPTPNNRPPVTIKCPYSKGCSSLNASTVSNGLGISYDFKTENIVNFKEINQNVNQLINKFSE